MSRPSRRALLAGAAALPLTGCGWTGRVPVETPGVQGSDGTLDSAFAPGGRATWHFAMPLSPKPKALIVALHGKGGNAQSSVELGLHTAAARAGLALISVSGGDGYWQARKDGTDSGRLVLEEVIPLGLREAQLRDAARIGFIGWSMGGYGSLLLAGQLPSERILGVAPMSAALWTEPGVSAPGAFDDREDFLAHDVFARSRLLGGIPVSMACGTSDPFIAGNRAYVAARPATRHTFDAGGHDGDYWGKHAPKLLAWLASLA